MVMRSLFLVIYQLDQRLAHFLLKLRVLHAEAGMAMSSHQGGTEDGVSDTLD